MVEADNRKYRVLSTLGKGGFGTVYKAELLGPGGFHKTVALKVLNSNATDLEGSSERLRDEARMLGLLRHRAIVQVDGMFQLNGRWTVVMEYIEGVDLKRLLGRGPLPVGAALEIAQEVANALYVAYERPSATGEPLHLLHRDIKPSNIHLTPAGEVKVLDFGVARAEFEGREAQTRSHAFGSIGYMSPERLENVNVHAGDVYSLGAVLHELITGEPVGKSTGPPEEHDALVQRALDALWKAAPNPDLYQLVAECLAWDPAIRPPAREVERRCRALRLQYNEPWLSDWAETVVPGLLAEEGSDDLAGAILTEGGPPRVEALPTPPPSLPPEDGTLPEAAPRPATPRHAPIWLFAAVTLGVALLVGGGGGAVLWWAWRARNEASKPVFSGIPATPQAAPSTPAPSPPATTAATVPPAATGSPSAATAATVPPAGTGAGAKSPAPATAAATVKPSAARVTAAASAKTTGSSATPTTPSASGTPAAEPDPWAAGEPEAPAGPEPAGEGGHGTVLVQGDVSDVKLERNGRVWPPGRLPVGTYNVLATLDGQVRTVGTVVVRDRQSVTLTCRARLRACVAM